MDAARALSELTEISSQIEAACLLDSEGNLVGSTLRDEGAAQRFAAAAAALLDGARRVAGTAAEKQLAQLEAVMPDASVFVVLDGDLAAAAVTRPEPTVGLVFYDLKSCLRAAGKPGDDDGKPRPRATSGREAASESAA